MTAQFTMSMRGVVNGNRVTSVFRIHQREDAIGLTSGNRYHEVAMLNENVSSSLIKGQASGNAVLHGTLVAAGPGNNIKFRQTIHFTINANVDVTVERDGFIFECQ